MAGHHVNAKETCLPASLSLAPNARVMLVKNVDVQDGLVNGACGTVTCLEFRDNPAFPAAVYVRFDDARVGSERRKVRAHAAVECRDSTVIDPEEEKATPRGGVRRQFPLKLAWACTVHKVQGLTVDEAVVSLHKVFAPGQAYVALSRVRTLSGLVIKDFKEKAIYCKDAIKENVASMPAFLVEKPQAEVDRPVLTVFLMNVQNLSRHLLDLVPCAQHLQPNCIAVTETWLTAHSSSASVQMEGYSFHSRPRGSCYTGTHPKLVELQGLEHGGVGLYTSGNLDVDILQTPDFNLECLVCLFRKHSAVMAVIYRPPCYPISLFRRNLDALLRWLHPIGTTAVVMGDFNDNILKGSTICKFMETEGFRQHVTQETTEKGTLIDHVYVRTTRFDVDCAVIPTYFSDHEGILCSFRLQGDQGEISDIEMMGVDEFADLEGLMDADFS